VRVKTETGKSNKVHFMIEGLAQPVSTAPESGPCGTWISVSGVGFGDAQSEMFDDGYQGVHHVVDVVDYQGATYTARGVGDWTDTSVTVRFNSFYQDTQDPETGQRNYVQDTGSLGYSEPTIRKCGDLNAGQWSVHVTTVYFQDEDQSGGLSPGDTILQVLWSDPVGFTLTVEQDTAPSDQIIQSPFVVEPERAGQVVESAPVFVNADTVASEEDSTDPPKNREVDTSDQGGCFLAVASGNSSLR